MESRKKILEQVYGTEKRTQADRENAQAAAKSDVSRPFFAEGPRYTPTRREWLTAAALATFSGEWALFLGRADVENPEAEVRSSLGGIARRAVVLADAVIKELGAADPLREFEVRLNKQEAIVLVETLAGTLTGSREFGGDAVQELLERVDRELAGDPK